MRTELPVCKRCCFCLPLRYGLITWGYIKLIAAIILSISLIITLVNIIEMMIAYGNSRHVHQVVVLCVILFILLTEVILNALFVVGGHMKNLKLLRVYYIYNIVLWALSIALALVLLGLMMSSVLTDHIYSFHAWVLLLNFSGFFVDIVVQSYVLLLLRSEIIKLRNNCEFRFVNNAAEAECTMKYKEEIVDEEKGTEDVSENGTCEIKDSCKKSCQCKVKCRRNDDEN